MFAGAMLAHEIDWRLVTYPCAADDKVDGLRVVFVGGEGYTRNGKTYETFRPFAQILRRVVGSDSIHVDCELTASNWNETSKLLKRIKNVDEDRIRREVVCHVFDVFSPETLGQEPYHARRQAVEWIVQQACAPEIRFHFQATRQTIVNSEEELQAAFQEALARGVEGLMVKTLDGVYVTKRSRAWQKIKPFIDITVTIVGGEHGWRQCPTCMSKEIREARTGTTSRTAKVSAADPNCGTCEGAAMLPDTDRLGAFLCKTAEGEDVKVGMGLTHDMQAVFMRRLGELVGKKADVKVQKDQGNAIVARHPVFLRFREDL